MDVLILFLENFIVGFNDFSVFMTTELFKIGGFSFTPLSFLTFSGFIAFLTVAIVKWGIS